MEKYPLFGISNHDNYTGQSNHNSIPWLLELQEPWVRIHEDTAAERGIKQGDLVRVFNDRGFVVLKAVLTKGIRPDTLLMIHGPQEADFIAGHNQSLTLMALDPLTSNDNHADLLCEVELYEGGAQ
jgi:molybdopterin-containing oxidoreductase family molybdopterin binding subunit